MPSETETDVNNEAETQTPAGQEPQQDTPETPETPPAPPEAPAEPEAPQVDPMAARLQEDNDRMRRENEEYRQFVLRQQQTQAPQGEQEVDLDKFIEENMGEKSAPVLKQLVKHLEKKLGKKFADRSEFEQTKQAALMASTRAQEQAAVARQRDDGVDDATIKEAGKQIMDWAKQGKFFPDADSAYEAAVGSVLKKKMYSAAENERRKKQAVIDGRKNASAPQGSAPSAPQGVPKRNKGESFEAYANRISKIELD